MVDRISSLCRKMFLFTPPKITMANTINRPKVNRVQFQQAERISPETNMKKAAMPTMIPATGTHLFTPPSSDRVFRMSPDGCNVFILMTVLVSIIFCL